MGRKGRPLTKEEREERLKTFTSEQKKFWRNYYKELDKKLAARQAKKDAIIQAALELHLKFEARKKVTAERKAAYKRSVFEKREKFAALKEEIIRKRAERALIRINRPPKSPKSIVKTVRLTTVDGASVSQRSEIRSDTASEDLMEKRIKWKQIEADEKIRLWVEGSMDNTQKKARPRWQKPIVACHVQKKRRKKSLSQ